MVLKVQREFVTRNAPEKFRDFRETGPWPGGLEPQLNIKWKYLPNKKLPDNENKWYPIKKKSSPIVQMTSYFVSCTEPNQMVRKNVINNKNYCQKIKVHVYA